MTSYYREALAAERLKRVYEIASPRIRRYLEAEIEYVRHGLRPDDTVLELGCGYGRVSSRLSGKAKTVIGIDTSPASLTLAGKMQAEISNCHFVRMDAAALAFPDRTFDVVVCVQNGISAFHVDRECLIRESVRVAKPGGIVLFSSYASKFWPHRLDWFRMQSEAGLIGEIDSALTKDGVIACKDGFRAMTVGQEEFKRLTSRIKNVEVTIEEIDESSLFCKIKSLPAAR